MSSFFFSSWQVLLRVTVVGIPAYFLLVLMLRVTGKRTLSKLNAFDLVVTVALGSTLATILLNKSVSLAEGVLALAVLIGLQYVVTWSSVRSPWIRDLVKAEPTLLVHQGQPVESALRKQRVTMEEVQAAVRESGDGTLKDGKTVVLETDGSISVIG